MAIYNEIKKTITFTKDELTKCFSNQQKIHRMLTNDRVLLRIAHRCGSNKRFEAYLNRIIKLIPVKTKIVRLENYSNDDPKLDFDDLLLVLTDGTLTYIYKFNADRYGIGAATSVIPANEEEQNLFLAKD